jgi:hypothetical protein
MTHEEINNAVITATEAYNDALNKLDDAKWRPGHSDRCNIYACTGTREDQKDDPKVGEMKTPGLAAAVIREHNLARFGPRRRTS